MRKLLKGTGKGEMRIGVLKDWGIEGLGGGDEGRCHEAGGAVGFGVIKDGILSRRG